MVFDDPMVGEEITAPFYTNRPESATSRPIGTGTWGLCRRSGRQLPAFRAINGTYSAQRQELDGTVGGLSVLTEAFAAQFVDRSGSVFHALAALSGVIEVPLT